MQTILVTGGAGFLGQAVVAKLQQEGFTPIVTRQSEFDFTSFEHTLQCLEQHTPDAVIHLAAYYGGIALNKSKPADIYYRNLAMATNLIEAAYRAGVQKFVGIGTACSYPAADTEVLKEEDFWKGLPEETVLGYGMAKKMMAIQGKLYRQQYGFTAIHLVLNNLYGPGDTFNLDRSTVAPALIRKFVEAKQQNKDEVEVWGSGNPQREFLYVEDCAAAIVLALQKYHDSEPLNIGTGEGTTIKSLAEKIGQIVRFHGKIFFNAQKPDGKIKRVLDVTKMKHILHWEPTTPLAEGLKKTIQWYEKNKEQADQK